MLSSSFKSSIALLVCGLTTLYVLAPAEQGLLIENEQDLLSTAPTKFSWSQIEPSASLKWTKCDLKEGVHFDCARLQVPLNYSDPDGEKAVIAMTRIPSALPSNSPDYRGPVLFNPGGPGGSGVELAVSAGSLLQQVVGFQFDVLGFDPRGVGHSTPGFDIYNSQTERYLYDVTQAGYIDLNSTSAVALAYSKAQIAGKLAATRAEGVVPFIHTDHTARDMLEIVKAHGRDKINYWGFSYGTILGGSFATMFPDNIERLVIDGIVDTDNYYNARWDDNLEDADKVMQNFFDTCHAAGPLQCSFYAPTPADISANLTKIYDRLQVEPIPVYDAATETYALVNYDFLRARVWQTLYQPYSLWPALADALAELAQGNATKIPNLVVSQPFPLDTDVCNTSEAAFDSGFEVTNAIGCNDARKFDMDLAGAQEHVRDVMDISEWGANWAKLRIGCSNWPESGQDRFQGPIGAEETSYPLLLIGNSLDPVTPWSHANRTHARFPGSALLSQNSPGHCSIAAPSPCTLQYINAYFGNGTLPEPGTWCEPSRGPFDSAEAWTPADEGEQAVFARSSFDIAEKLAGVMAGRNAGLLGV